MIRIEQVSWTDAKPPLARIRRKVFIEEQQVPEELEWDGEDAEALHLLAYKGDTPIGTVRMLADGHVGRMAVLKEYRQQGIGWLLMQEIISLARQQGLLRLALSAQTHAIEFYQRLGFIAQGDTFLDAGIPHRQMTLLLSRE